MGRQGLSGFEIQLQFMISQLGSDKTNEGGMVDEERREDSEENQEMGKEKRMVWHGR